MIDEHELGQTNLNNNPWFWGINASVGHRLVDSRKRLGTEIGEDSIIYKSLKVIQQ